MKTKYLAQARGPLLAVLALSAGIIAANSQNSPSCVNSSHSGPSCGGAPAHPPGCIETVCNDNWVDCTGPNTDFYCTSTTYTLDCTEYRLTWTPGWFGASCDDPGDFFNTTTVTCSQAEEIGGCGG